MTDRSAHDARQQEFHRRVPADPEQLVGLRRALTQWVDTLGIAPEQQDDVILASYEAMANAAEHGYRDSAGGPVEVRAVHRDHSVTVTVTDFGTWKQPDPDDTYRGRGLPLIETLSDTSATAHRADGTTVTMSWNLRPDL